MGGCKAPITTFIVEPFVPHDQEYYLSIVSERLGCTISFSECGGIEIEENWDKVKTIFLPTEKQMTPDVCAPLIAMLPLEVISHASLWFPIMPFVLFPMSLNLLLLAFSSSRLTVQYSSSV
jgi:succinyl-CoA synthetase beta subunit